MQHYFLLEQSPQEKKFQLPADIRHHFLTVLRAVAGDECELVLKDHQTYLVRLIDDQGCVQVVKNLPHQSELPVETILACGIPKTKEKPAWIVQKSTELGVREIVFFNAQRSVSLWKANKRAKKLQRLQKIAQGAAEQSHRNYSPKISYADNWQQALQITRPNVSLVAWEESAKRGERAQLAQQLQKLQKNQRLLALFGPEGGLTSEEVSAMKDAGMIAVGLGPRILRTETAPLYLMAAVSYQLELLNC